MFAKMGCKVWSSGSQQGLRIYTPSIQMIASTYDFPSSDGRWDSLNQFLASVSGNNVLPYSRRLLIVDQALVKEGISATMTIAQHGHTSQGYITAPQNTWLHNFVDRNLGKDLEFEYIASTKEDLLVIPTSSRSIIAQRQKESIKLNRKVGSVDRRIHFTPPPDASKIGLYYELKELDFLRSKGLSPSHRHPYITTKISNLVQKRITCDIDVLDINGNFVKFVEVKAVSGAPGSAFILTSNEWKSREKCRTTSDEYEIVVYYHAGLNILKREVIDKRRALTNEPFAYWCEPT